MFLVMMGGTHMFLKEAYVHLFAEEGKERGKRGEREGKERGVYAPISSGRWLVSEAIVDWLKMLTATCGFGGSERSWRFALRRLCPTVLTPIRAPALRKFLPLREPGPIGFCSAHTLFMSFGRSSDGVS
jgi:hypothetical protein